MIVVRDLVKFYGDVQVLRGVNLHIEKGKRYGIAGRSGTGKSTLLRCINRLEDYNGGVLTVGGVDVRKLSPKDLLAFRKNIGMIFQHFSLLERLTVYENIALPLRCWKYKSSFIDRKVKELLGMVGIPEKANQKPRELSGGQKQRVAIARALTMDPHILLCDEATSALDPNTAKSVIALLNRINEELGITIVVVTHQMSVLKSACESLAILENGRISASGLVEHIFSQQPAALRNLTGESASMPTEANPGVCLSVAKSDFFNPLFGKMILDLEINAAIAPEKSARYGETGPKCILVTISEDDYHKMQQYLALHKIQYEIIRQASSRVTSSPGLSMESPFL